MRPGLKDARLCAECVQAVVSVFERRFGILPPIKREALTMKVEWPAFTVERWPNHSPDQLRLQQAPPRGNLGYSITSSARHPGDPRCSALAANRPSQWIYEEFASRSPNRR